MTALWERFLAWLADRLIDLAERFGPGLFEYFTACGVDG